MPRGRQYYDPIVQVPSTVENPDDVSRIELFPEVVGDVITRWCARKIRPDGTIVESISGSIDHDEVLSRAQQTWPGLEVFELKSEGEDSTHEGMGPSPRLWQNGSGVNIASSSPGDADGASRQSPPQGSFPEDVGASPGPGDDQLQLRAFVVSAGVYVPLEDVVLLLRSWATQYETEKNPSAAMALSEAADVLYGVEVE